MPDSKPTLIERHILANQLAIMQHLCLAAIGNRLDHLVRRADATEKLLLDQNAKEFATRRCED